MTKFSLPAKCLVRVRKRPLLLLMFSAAVAVAGWYVWGDDESHAAQDAGTYWLSVKPARLEQQLGLVGRIQAARQETLTAPFDGVIRELAVQEGQSVEAGQVLARLDPGRIEIQLRQAQAELLKAQREVNQLRDWDKSTDVARARRSLISSRDALSTTQSNLRETRILFERGIVARMEIDSLEAQLRSQQQDLIAAQEELKAIEYKGQGEERKIAEMELANAQERLQILTAQYERQVIKAPFTGVVIRQVATEDNKTVIIQPGVMVTQGTSLFSVIALDRLQVLTKVEESDLHRLTQGMPVKITGDGFIGKELDGHISSIAIQSDFANSPGMSAQYDVTVAVDTPSDTARLGMSARLAIILYSNEHGIAIPPQALNQDDNGAMWVNYRSEQGTTPQKKMVTTGISVVQGIEVTGLPAGYIEVPVQH